MIKQISMLAAVGLVLMVVTERESHAHGFGGYHGVAGVRAGGVRVGGVGVGGVRVGGVGVGGVRVGGVGGVYGRGVGGVYGRGIGSYGAALPYDAYGDGYGNVYLPPKPGKGPAGISSIGDDNKSADNSRSSSQSALNQALNHMKLPSDAGLPATKKDSGK